MIDQLSPDEAMILHILSKDYIYYDYIIDLNSEENKFTNSIVRKDTTPKVKIIFMENFNMNIEHMKSLNLVFWRKTNETAVCNNNKQTGTFINTCIELTEFGSWFSKACIPENGFTIIS